MLQQDSTERLLHGRAIWVWVSNYRMLGLRVPNQVTIDVALILLKVVLSCLLVVNLDAAKSHVIPHPRLHP